MAAFRGEPSDYSSLRKLFTRTRDVHPLEPPRRFYRDRLTPPASASQSRDSSALFFKKLRFVDHPDQPDRTFMNAPGESVVRTSNLLYHWQPADAYFQLIGTLAGNAGRQKGDAVKSCRSLSIFTLLFFLSLQGSSVAAGSPPFTPHRNTRRAPANVAHSRRNLRIASRPHRPSGSRPVIDRGECPVRLPEANSWCAREARCSLRTGCRAQQPRRDGTHARSEFEHCFPPPGRPRHNAGLSRPD